MEADKRRKRNDRILIAVILCCAVVLFLVSLLLKKGVGNTVVITVAGKEYGRYSLLEEQTIKIGDGNVVRIQEHTVQMQSADCPDQLCVMHTPIQKNNETILCLPNQVAVTIETPLVINENTSDVDAVVR